MGKGYAYGGRILKNEIEDSEPIMSRTMYMLILDFISKELWSNKWENEKGHRTAKKPNIEKEQLLKRIRKRGERA